MSTEVTTPKVKKTRKKAASTDAPKKRKSKKKADNHPLIASSSSQTLGIRKTRLMELAEGYGDSGLMNPRSIDPIVYMLAEMGESAFGSKFIDDCQDGIALSNANFPKQKALGFLADRMIRKYLAQEFNSAGKKEIGNKLTRMPVLNGASYVDYFMTMATIEREAFRTPIHPAIDGLVKMVTGYETEQPAAVCDAVVNFFKVSKDVEGFKELLTDFCRLVKTQR